MRIEQRRWKRDRRKNTIVGVCIVLSLIVFVGIDEAIEEGMDENRKWFILVSGGGAQEMKESVTRLLQKNIVPQAFDRNHEGKIFLVSQLSPPVRFIDSWQLERYRTEKEMMLSIEEHARSGRVPTGFDVQKDGAFVQYVKNGLQVNNIRLLKVQTIDELIQSARVYHNLGYFLNGLTQFNNQLWVLFVRYRTVSTKDFSVRILNEEKEKVSMLLSKGLSEKGTQISAFSFTREGKAVAVFMESGTEQNTPSSNP